MKKQNNKNVPALKISTVDEVQKTAIFTSLPAPAEPYTVGQCDALQFLRSTPRAERFDLVITSPPYNLGKCYEEKRDIDAYLRWQETIIVELIPRVKEAGSICWQVGNYVENGHIEPLDILMHPLFKKHNLQLRNRIVWRFGHGLHCRRRFSGRYETVLWYSKSENYYFNLDSVRVASKYPGKRYYKGPNAGKLSSHPAGKNPEDVWDIPNVKGNHCEKTQHPCQFPVGLVQRLILALSKPDDTVFDPFTGVGSTGVAAAILGRRFIGTELKRKYVLEAKSRIDAALKGEAKFRAHDKELYDHKQSPLSIRPVA